MPFDINHDVEDLEKLDKKLQKFSKEDLKIVLEQTGTYHLLCNCRKCIKN